MFNVGCRECNKVGVNWFNTGFVFGKSMYARADCSGKTAERLVIWRYIFIVVVM